MNLYKGFKKIAEDDQKAVLEHDNGHQLSIAKSGLSRQHKNALSKLPLHQAKGTQPIEQQDAGSQAKAVGVNIADAVASKILEGATEVATPAPISPEQISKMPEATATDVQTGMPVAKAAGATAPETDILAGGGSRKIDVKNLPASPSEIFSKQLSPGGASLNWEMARQAVEKDKEVARQQAAQQGLAPEATATEKGLASTTPPEVQAPSAAAAAPQVAPTQAAPSLTPTAPIVPKQPRTPEEILRDPKAELSEQLYAQNQLYQTNLKALQDSREQEKQILSKLEPKKVFSDASLGNKILMAISAIAGGVGAGLTGRENAALKAMDDIFQRDWEAQKTDQSNRLTLHKINQDALKDEMAARLQSMANMKSIMVAKMEEAEGKYGIGSPAQRRIELARLQLEDDISKLKTAAAERQTMAQIRNMAMQPSAPGAKTAQVEPSVLISQAEPGLKTKAIEEINHRKEINELAPELLRYFDQIDSMSYTPGAVKSFQGLLTSLVPKIEGRSSEAANEAAMSKYTPGKFNLTSPGANKNIRQSLVTWLKSKSGDSAFRAATNGLSLDNFGSTAHAWAHGADPEEGKIAVNRKTGQMLIKQQGQWVPYAK